MGRVVGGGPPGRGPGGDGLRGKALPRGRPAGGGSAGVMATVILFLLILLPQTLAAQSRVIVLPEPDGTLVSLALLLRTGLDAGPADTHCIAANAVVRELRPQLDALDARAEAVCMPARVRFTLLTRTVTWRVAADIFLTTLFDHQVGDRAFVQAREAARRRRQIECNNPGYRLRTRLHAAFYGASSPIADAECGETGTEHEFSVEQAREFMSARFLPARAAAAVAGPVEADAVRESLARALGDIQIGRAHV